MLARNRTGPHLEAQSGKTETQIPILLWPSDGQAGLRPESWPVPNDSCPCHHAVKLLRQIPSIGPIRAALLVALLQTPHRFRSKRQLWAYSGFAVETHDSGEYRFVRGKLRRNRERITVRGLNHNHNHDLKNLFKGAAISASTRPGPLCDFYVALVEKGMRPTMACLTLARKMAAITLTIWKKGARPTPLGWLYDSETV